MNKYCQVNLSLIRKHIKRTSIDRQSSLQGLEESGQVCVAGLPVIILCTASLSDNGFGCKRGGEIITSGTGIARSVRKYGTVCASCLVYHVNNFPVHMLQAKTIWRVFKFKFLLGVKPFLYFPGVGAIAVNPTKAIGIFLFAVDALYLVKTQKSIQCLFRNLWNYYHLPAIQVTGKT